jgi:hypothetical protein
MRLLENLERRITATLRRLFHMKLEIKVTRPSQEASKAVKQ